MAILSWLTSKQRFSRKSAIDEFKEFAHSEEKRQRSSDSDFDKDTFQQAVQLVMQKLSPSGKGHKS